MASSARKKQVVAGKQAVAGMGIIIMAGDGKQCQALTHSGSGSGTGSRCPKLLSVSSASCSLLRLVILAVFIPLAQNDPAFKV